MKLTVIIVNYNVKYFVEQCLISVERALQGLEGEVFVVDNHSQDGSIDYLKPRFPWVKFIESNHNNGFAKANNMAIRQSEGQYLLLLNPDTFVAEDVLRKAVDFMDGHPKAGGVGVRMHNSDGTLAMESRRGLPTPMVSFLKMLGRSDRYYMTHLSWNEPARIDIISGAFCMVRREAIDAVGMLDEDFFMYGEDIDLSYRLLKGGYENWFLPLDILHYKGESTHKSSFRYVHVFYQAMLIFFRKHYSHLSLLITLPIKFAICFRAMMACVMTMYWNMRKSLGFIDRSHTQTVYLFKGSDEMIAECRELARRKGLTEIAECREQACRKGLTEASGSLQPTCIVYDTDTYSFTQLLSEAANAVQPLKIGTYSRRTKVLITQAEVIR